MCVCECRLCEHVSTCVHACAWRRPHSCLIHLDSSLISREFSSNPPPPQKKRICFTATYHQHSIYPSVSPPPSPSLGRVSPCRQVHAPVAAKVPTCPPYARLRSASLLLPLPTRIQLAGPPQICSSAPPTIHPPPHTHHFFSHTHPPPTSSLPCQFSLLSRTKRLRQPGSHPLVLSSSMRFISPPTPPSPLQPFSHLAPSSDLHLFFSHLSKRHPGCPALFFPETSL